MRKLLVLLILAVAPPAWAEDSAKDMKPLQVPCDIRAEVLEAKVAALQARLQSLSAYVELLKTEPGQRFAYLEEQGNKLLEPLQKVTEKATAACGEGLVFDLNEMQCQKKEQSPSAPAASAP